MDNTDDRPPLAVDLDGSLLKTDSLWECLFRTAAVRPWRLARLPATYIAGGRAAVKGELAQQFPLEDVKHWPYNRQVIDVIRAGKEEGREICLATAAHQSIACAVADHLGCFDAVIASTDTENRKGRAKLDALNKQYGEGNFAYIGDSDADLPLWEQCREAIVVGAPASSLAKKVAAVKPGAFRLIPRERPGFGAFARALRLRQWPKNLLIFVPQLLGHVFTLEATGKNLLAFFAFSFLASAVYVLNDILDLPADRMHPRKRRRPFASGELPLSLVPALLPALIFCAVAAAWRLPREFHLCLAGYFLINILYSHWIKRKKMLDVSVLAGMYVLRLIAGIMVLALPLSNWLLGFGFFMFLALALMKRTSELAARRGEFRREVPGRGYVMRDRHVLRQMAITSGFSGITIFALYIESLKAAELYARPFFLWALCPLLIYWFGRLALVAERGVMRDDPFAFVLGDRVSWLMGLVGAGVLILAWL